MISSLKNNSLKLNLRYVENTNSIKHPIKNGMIQGWNVKEKNIFF